MHAAREFVSTLASRSVWSLNNRNSHSLRSNLRREQRHCLWEAEEKDVIHCFYDLVLSCHLSYLKLCSSRGWIRCCYQTRSMLQFAGVLTWALTVRVKLPPVSQSSRLLEKSASLVTHALPHALPQISASCARLRSFSNSASCLGVKECPSLAFLPT